MRSSRIYGKMEFRAWFPASSEVETLPPGHHNPVRNLLRLVYLSNGFRDYHFWAILHRKGVSGSIFTNPTLIELRQEIGQYDWLASPRADDVSLCSRMEIITKQAIECGL
ncbi:hypothetical protein AVEN_92985-1 [Araneus ventricosus]|uniref:Uncharacterized protein n=1 Tax=Araneus ventricosus TaxID=182803 RepID=A0A4Y2JMB7_ARAVE|nr:hypothetical protein AVEN_92985-1 [Araneus ventricosus]